MKQILIVTILFSIHFTSKGQSNLQQIEIAIGWYFDGWGTGDTTKLGKAMHSTCHLKFYRDGKFNDITRADYLSRFKPRAKPDSLTCRIVSLDIVENIAAAKTEIILGSAVFTDYFNLIKTDEGWFIVDKISVRQNK